MTTSTTTTTTTNSTTSTTLNPLLKWALPLGPVYYSAPALGSDETIYVGTSHWGLYEGDSTTLYGLYAIKPDGALKWKYTTGLRRPIRGSPAIGPDGTIYFVVEVGTSEIPPPPKYEELVAVSAAGEYKWKSKITEDSILEIGCLTPAIGADGTIYVNGSGTYAFNPDGTLKWRIAGNVVHSSPAVAADGTIIAAFEAAGGTVTGLQAIKPDGTLKWSYPPFAYFIVSSPVLGSDGTIYIGAKESGTSNQRVMLAITSTGTLEWKYVATTEGDIRGSAAVDSDGTIYFGTTHAAQNHIYALKPDGSLKWKYNTYQDVLGSYGHDLYSSPAIGADGLIYFFSEYGYIYAFNRDGTINWKDATISNNTMSYVWSSPAIAGDGTLYVGGVHGVNSLFAIKSASRGILTGAPSPKFRVDNKNTGRSQ